MLEFTAALAAIKGTKDLLTGALNAKVDADVKAKVYEAREKIGSIQDSMFDLREKNLKLLEENGALKAEMANANTWQVKLDAYERVKAPGGAMVYRSKAELLHYVCPSCLNKHEIHMLQDSGTESGAYQCTGCKTYFDVDPATYSSCDDDARSWKAY